MRNCGISWASGGVGRLYSMWTFTALLKLKRRPIRLGQRREDDGNRTCSLGLLRELVEPEQTAAEIKDLVICGYVGFESGGDRIQALLAAFLDLEETGFAHDAQMLGNVVLGDVQMFGDVRDAHWLLEQETEYTLPCLFA